MPSLLPFLFKINWLHSDIFDHSCTSSNMQWKLFLIYLIGTVLLASSKTTSPQIDQLKFSGAQLKKTVHTKLLAAFVIGNKKGLTKKERRHYQQLCLGHLFTPSGIHLAALYLVLMPLIGRIRKRNKIMASITQMVLPLPLYFLSGFYSLKRIATLKLLHQVLPKSLGASSLFALTFIGDFLWGSYDSNPLSFSYSFLFLGVIISQIEHPKAYLPWALAGAQIISSYFSENQLTLIAPFLGFILTLCFGPFFIFFVVMFFFKISALEFTIAFYHQLVLFCSKINSYFPQITIDLSTLLIPFIFLLPLNLFKRVLMVVILIGLYCPPINNLPVKTKIPATYKTPWNWIDKSEVRSIVRYYRGYRIDYKSSWRCYYQHYNWFYRERCY